MEGEKESEATHEGGQVGRCMGIECMKGEDQLSAHLSLYTVRWIYRFACLSVPPLLSNLSPQTTNKVKERKGSIDAFNALICEYIDRWMCESTHELNSTASCVRFLSRIRPDICLSFFLCFLVSPCFPFLRPFLSLRWTD